MVSAACLGIDQHIVDFSLRGILNCISEGPLSQGSLLSELF